MEDKPLISTDTSVSGCHLIQSCLAHSELHEKKATPRWYQTN